MPISNFANAVASAYSAFREGYTNPENSRLNIDEVVRRQIANKNWEFYTNEAYEDLSRWGEYLKTRGMYDYTRLLYNPMRRLVDFYAGAVYNGRLSLDGNPFPNSVNLAIPLADDMDNSIKGAIAQIWQWSNWQNGMKLMVRYAASSGDCLIEISDDTLAGKVRLDVFWTTLSAGDDLVLDAVGNVKQYGIEYYTQKDDEYYVFKKVVNQDEISFYKNGQPFDYGYGDKIPNPYGFAPAVWVKHTDLGGAFGSSAFRGNFIKMDETNSVATHVHDLIHKKADPPIILWTKDQVRNAFRTDKNNPNGQSEFADEIDVRVETMVLKGSEGGRAEPLVGNLGIAEALPWMQEVIAEMEKDHPELTFFQKLREMQQVTGPGARRLLGDAQFTYDEAASNYDSASVRAFQMALAIGGMRFKEGRLGWFNPTEQQKKFAPFSLESYKRDELTVDIMPRELIADTEDDAVDLEGRKLDNANKATFFPRKKVFQIAGVTDEAELTALLAEKQTEVDALLIEPDNPNDDEET